MKQYNVIIEYVWFVHKTVTKIEEYYQFFKYCYLLKFVYHIPPESVLCIYERTLSPRFPTPFLHLRNIDLTI